ncbi:unnamed protein product [Anisakis simplex]|uniref:Integron gene cassette protein n=1 Tax=Anisakis simplex TaxID=6269 RepID=A0A0M3JFJ6_ANISI|nr:unnamed protein product [Anisakis simplex]
MKTTTKSPAARASAWLRLQESGRASSRNHPHPIGKSRVQSRVESAVESRESRVQSRVESRRREPPS